MRTLNFLILMLSSFMCLADGPTFSGNLTPQCGTTETYNVTWQEWTTQYENHSQVTWSVDKGTIISYTNHSIVIEWNNCASEGILMFMVVYM